MPCEIGTIRQIHQQLRQEGYYIGEGALRQWVKDGSLPAIRVGNRALISCENVKAVLHSVSVAK